MQRKFSKRAKLSKLDHFFIIVFLIGATYLGIIWRLIPFAIVYPIAILYLIFIISLEYRDTKGKIYQSAMAKEQRRYSTISSRTETAPKVRKTYKKPVDFNYYITKATNHNLFVAGSSGTGKTTLMRHMIGLFPNSAKTIFSFKANDDYLKLGISILKVAEYAGEPFSDKEAFVQAFLVAYPINAQKAQEAQKKLDYRAKVLEMLENEASWPSKLAKDIAKAEGMTDEPKLAVSKALKALQSEGLIARQSLELEDKEVMLYYRRDPSMSGLHKFMVNEVIKKLEEKGTGYTLAKPGEDKPDIMTKDFDIEVETGLKKDLTEFRQKLSKTIKKTYTVVINETEKEKYEKLTYGEIDIIPVSIIHWIFEKKINR